MRLADLPRLNDEERAALDDCAAIAGVPASSIDDLVDQRGRELQAMRDAGNDWSAFSAASRREAELAARIRRVRRNLAAAAASLTEPNPLRRSQP